MRQSPREVEDCRVINGVPGGEHHGPAEDPTGKKWAPSGPHGEGAADILTPPHPPAAPLLTRRLAAGLPLLPVVVGQVGAVPQHLGRFLWFGINPKSVCAPSCRQGDPRAGPALGLRSIK